MAERVAAGARIVGHKVGLTSLAMQQQLGVDQPDFGHLLDDMMHPEGQPVPIGRFIAPKVEPEIAFLLARPLSGPGVTVPAALAAVGAVLPAVEIIDSRIVDWRITLADTIADNASSGGVVVGSRPIPIENLDLRLLGCVMQHNGAPAGVGAGAAVLGSPINALVWLANVLGERGVGLEEGHVVLPGSMTVAVAVEAGDVVTAEFGGLGTLTIRFE